MSATGRGGMAEGRPPRAGGSEPLRVGIIAPISWRTPPRHYGPWELFCSLLTEGLVARGVDVTLFATRDSVTSARLEGVARTGYSEDPTIDAKVSEALHIANAVEHARDLDLLHNSADFLPLTFSRLLDTPMVTTVHGFGSEATVPVFQAYADRCSYVSISDADRHPALPYAATIHHGIDVDAFALQAGEGHHLAFFGRIHPDKGTVAAIEVAARAGLPLLIAGIVQDDDYFRTAVEPHVDGDRVRYLGSVGPAERQQVLGGARALLHLIDFEEPFGFSVVEAMACGTPVIATPRGSMPELIEPGVNGVLVADVDAAVAAVSDVVSLDRAAVRASAVRRFHVDRMVDEYLALYRRLLGLDDLEVSRTGS
jgi:glycosyltransferase involved in cell wall biosynthesis